MLNPLNEIRAYIKVDPDKAERFHKVLKDLREENKALSLEQYNLRIQRKPSRGNINKSRRTAIEITAIINLSRLIRRLPDKYTAEIRCRCCGHTVCKTLSVHNVPSDEYELQLYTNAVSKYIALYNLGEFVTPT